MGYSDSDISESDCSSFEYASQNHVDFKSSPNVCVTDEDFFNLKDIDKDNNARFWTSTLHDNDLLPCTVPMIQKDDDSSLQKDECLKDENLLRQNITCLENHTATKNSDSDFSISYVIDHKASNITDTNDTIIYPRLSLHWPYLALCGPLCKQRDETVNNLSSHILIWRLPYSDTFKTPLLICGHRIHINHELTSSTTATSSLLNSRRDYYCWSKLYSTATNSQSLQLVAATSKGFIEIWEINQAKKLREFNVSSQTGQLLRCASLQIKNCSSSSPSSSLLVSGTSGIISLWDLRISTSALPQLRFSHTELKTSIADLLWLNENHFSSCSDTIDRNNCEHNVAVWDIRFTKPISRQLYQERWGCNRLALKPTFHSSHTIRFAVQTQGDAIVEIHSKNLKKSTSSNHLSYHLEKRWRYEGHQIQAHPLGLAYNPSGSLLASGSWSSSGPVVWSTAHRTGLTTMKKLPEVRNSQKFMTTDVVWIPNKYVPNGGNSIIAVQSNGNIVVYCSL
ncbi:Palmitoyltransferase ZDHHC [Schistosoma japonicum]|nr:Palmitoyltransferase ZDHHC [Schistosoma japonicum]